MPIKIHKTTFTNALMVAAMAFVLVGCASAPRKTYTGEPLLENQIARISVEVKKSSFFDSKWPARIYITHVDQQPLGGAWSGGLLNEVADILPGDRSIAVISIDQNSSTGVLGALPTVLIQTADVANKTSKDYQSSGYGKVLKLNAKAGHKYIVKYIAFRLPLICWVEDETTGEVVSGEKPPEPQKVRSVSESTQQFVAVPNQKVPVENMEKGRIYVLRTEQLGFSLTRMKVFDGEQEIGDLGADSFLCWERDPGKTTLYVDTYTRNGTIINMPEELEVKGGKVYYFYTSASGKEKIFLKDGYQPMDRFWRLDNTEGERLLKGCNPPPLATPKSK